MRKFHRSCNLFKKNIMTFKDNIIFSCAFTVTDIGREVTVRPLYWATSPEQCHWSRFQGCWLCWSNWQRKFIETQALSKLDIQFINGYIAGLAIENNAVVVNSLEDVDIKIFNIVKTSGTDDIERRIFTDKARGEFNSVMSFVNLKTMKVIKTYEISGVADEVR